LTIKLQGRHLTQLNWSSRITGGAGHLHRTRLPGRVLKNDRSDGNGAYTWKGTTSKVMVASRSKTSFWQVGSISPSIDWPVFMRLDMNIIIGNPDILTSCHEQYHTSCTGYCIFWQVQLCKVCIFYQINIKEDWT
jgi:hypothetical protein